MTPTRDAKISTYTNHLHLHQSKIPQPSIVTIIISIIGSVLQRTEITPPLLLPHLYKAYHDEQRIGSELMTRGFLAKSWIPAIRHYTKDKTIVKIKAILLGLWHNILEPVWECRNNISHKGDNIVTIHAHKQLDQELMDWKHLAHERLNYTQIHLVSYSRSDFHHWTLQHKKNTLHILQLAHRNYKHILDSELVHSQRLIISFFKPLSRS